MITLRPYQQKALEAILTDFRPQQFVLLQAATGAGKTIIFSELIRLFRQQWPDIKILLVAHREQLVRQAYEKLLKVWPEGAGQVGIACNSVSSKAELDKPVIIGSIQTIARRIDELPVIKLMIVDEVHMMPPMAKEGASASQYEEVIHSLQAKYDKLRVLGVTATPYRLGWGYIYGQDTATDSRKSEDPARNWFPELTYSISIKQLTENGFLCPMRMLTVDEPDLSDIGMSVSGDYNEKALGKKMSEKLHLGSILRALNEHAIDRHHIVIFTVTIEHAKTVLNELKENGWNAVLVHSQMLKKEAEANLAAFNSGEAEIIVNVGKLTEGWDCPIADCVMLCRPTKSTALYVQMVGRGLRLAEGKADCLVLDLAGCFAEHGNVNTPKVRKGRGVRETVFCPECGTANPAASLYCKKCAALLRKPTTGEQQTGSVECPNCKSASSNRAIFCPVCGFALRWVENKRVELHEIDLEEDTDNIKPCPARILSKPVGDFDYVSRKGAKMLRISYRISLQDRNRSFRMYDYWDIEGVSHNNSYGAMKAAQKWELLAQTTAPKTLEEARTRWGELEFPEKITVKKKDGFWNVVRYTA